MFEKKDLLIIISIVLCFFLVLFFFPTKKFELHIGKSAAIIDDKNKYIIVKADYNGIEKIIYRIHPFFIKIYIQPIYFGDKIGVYKNEKPILIKNNMNYEINKFGAYNILIIDYMFMKKKYNFYILDGNLPVITIDLAKKNVKINPVNKIPMAIKIISNNDSFAFNDKEGFIRERGHARKYNIWFSKPVKILGLPKRKKVSLVGEIKDNAFFRDKLSFDLYGLIDSTKPYPKTFFTELFIDGIYYGVYILEERYDNKLFEYKKYNKTQLKPAVIFRCIEGAAFNTKFNSIIGNIKKGSDDFYKKFNHYFKQDEPNIKKKNCMPEIWDLVFFILDSSDTEFYDKTNGIYSKIDINSVIDVFLLIQLIRDTDCISNNLYYSRKEITNINEKPLFVMSSWDHDRAFGWKYEIKSSYAGFIGLDSSIGKVNLLFRRLFKNPETRERIKKRWFELRKNNWSNESVLNLFEEQRNIIKNTYNRMDNQYIYRYSKKNTFTQQDDINYRIEWIQLRLSWLDDYFNKLK